MTDAPVCIGVPQFKIKINLISPADEQVSNNWNWLPLVYKNGTNKCLQVE